MDSKNQILKYFNDTYSIRNILEGFPPLNPDEAGTGTSALAPWAIASISINTGLTESDVLEELEEIPGASVESVEVDGVPVQVVRMAESLGVQAHASHQSHEIGSMKVYEAMNLHLFQFSWSRVEETDRPVKVEEAIFDLKNNAFLPDDFMPEHIMGMVEGDLSLSVEEIHDSYTLSPAIRLFYLFHERKGNSAGRVRFIYPAKVNFSDKIPTNQQIREKITSSFSALRTDKKYMDFENSRLLKTVIFNIESKNTRELKRPAFDPRKINLLESMGIAEKTGESAKIRESVSVDQIKALYADMKKQGEQLSREWLRSTIALKD